MAKHYGEKVTIPDKKARAVLDGKAVSTGVRQIAGDGAVVCPNPPSIESGGTKSSKGSKSY